MPGRGTSSQHSSLYESRHPSPVPLPTSTPHREAVGETLDHPSGPRTVPLELLAGSSSQIESSQSSSTKNQSQQDIEAETSQWSPPATPVRPLTHHDPLPPSPYETPITPLDRPPSRRNSRPPTPTTMTLSNAINFYEQTINDPSIAVPTILKQARYEELYVYFAYELPLYLTWGETQGWKRLYNEKDKGTPCWQHTPIWSGAKRSLPMELVTSTKRHGRVSPLWRRSTRDRDPGTHARRPCQ